MTPGRYGLWAVAIKLAARTGKGFHFVCKDLQPHRAFVVHAGDDRYDLAPNVEAIGLARNGRLAS